MLYHSEVWIQWLTQIEENSGSIPGPYGIDSHRHRPSPVTGTLTTDCFIQCLKDFFFITLSRLPQRDSSPKNFNYPMIYTPSIHPRCTWLFRYLKRPSEVNRCFCVRKTVLDPCVTLVWFGSVSVFPGLTLCSCVTITLGLFVMCSLLSI